MSTVDFNSNDVAAFRRLIDEAKRVALVGHRSPDGDALGSTLGLCHILRKRGVDARVITPDEPGSVLRSIPGCRNVMAFSSFGPIAAKFIQSCDLILCMDFNTLSRLDKLEPAVRQATCPKVHIDHHLYPEDFGDITFSYPGMSATCELTYLLLNAADMADEIDLTAATCFTSGIMTDTGGLHYNSDRPELFDVMAGLMRRGVDKTRIVRFLNDTQSTDAMRLESFALSQRMTILPDAMCAIIALSRDDLNKFNYSRGDTEGLVNRPLAMPGIAYSVFFREEDKEIKVSTRSLGTFPVNQICSDLYGGGGHLNAAGGEFYGTLEQAVERLLENIPRYTPLIDENTLDIVRRRSLLPNSEL